MAVPASEALPMLGEVQRKGAYSTAAPRAWLGITCYPLGAHVVVAAALPESPAEHAGVSAGDVILAIDELEVNDRRTLYQQVWRRRPGETVKLSVQRESGRIDLEVETSSIEAFFA
jgi:S1-C subfamily serine protease